MSDRPYQLPLGISRRDDLSFENFYQGENAQAVAAVKSLVLGQGEPFVFLWGRSVGSSHLLQAACVLAEQHQQHAVYLPLAELVDYGPVVLEGLEQLAVVCLDDLELVAGQALWEESLFHLFNRLQLSGSALLIASDLPPWQLGIELPDLSSRLQWGLVYGLHPLDDAGKGELLRLRAHQKGIDLADEVLRYLLKHVSRELNDLMLMLDRLDHLSLSTHRRITVPFVREVLESRYDHHV